MEKRLIIAVALSLLILVGFQKFFPAQKKTGGQIPAQSQMYQVDKGDTSAQESTAPATVQIPHNEKNISVSEKIETIKAGKYSFEFTNIGGSLKKLALHGTEEITEDKTLFLSRQGHNLFDITSKDVGDLDKRGYTLSREKGLIAYTYEEKGWVRITKGYEFFPRQDYLILTVETVNLSPEKLTFSYQIMGPSELGGQNQVAGRNFLEADVMMDDKIWRKRGLKRPLQEKGRLNWAALKNRYFAFIIKPFFDINSFTAVPANSNLRLFLNRQSIRLDPGEKKADKYLFYAGPLDEKALKTLGHGMDKLIDYGFFAPVSKILLSILEFFHGLVHNWGIAIILLTITVNLILFPLTFKSFASMQQMKKIQPHLQKLKEMHKDNPQKLNKETMELYKKYNVNPLGGCLPLLLQMPIFIALYQGLIHSIRLKGAHFLWIKDLASPDAIVKMSSPLPLIGKNINLLPLLMIGAMFFQQKTSQINTGTEISAQQQQQQKTMMLLMPLLFGVFFYKMPSGLVLYWLTNTVLMTVEHKFISGKIG